MTCKLQTTFEHIAEKLHFIEAFSTGSKCPVFTFTFPFFIEHQKATVIPTAKATVNVLQQMQWDMMAWIR